VPASQSLTLIEMGVATRGTAWKHCRRAGAANERTANILIDATMVMMSQAGFVEELRYGKRGWKGRKGCDN
jgi:hypothetical protein